MYLSGSRYESRSPAFLAWPDHAFCCLKAWMNQKLVNSWLSARPVTLGSMAAAWVSTLLPPCRKLTSARSADPTCGRTCYCAHSSFLALIDLLMSPHCRKFTKRIRQSSAATSRNPPRTSRSHSPTYLLKQPKRRNTMNSRDAAYDIQALLESTAAEAEAEAARSTGGAAASPIALTVHIPDTNRHSELNGEMEIVSSSRRKRKRTDDDALVASPLCQLSPVLI